MNNLVSTYWLSYREKINNRFPEYYKYLNPPASEDEILHLQTVLGYEIPAEMKTLYRLNNGESTEGQGIFYGLQFLSLSEVERNWLCWKEIIEDGLEDLNDFCTSYPERVIQSIYAHEKWIPFMHDGGGNHIGIDLAPDVNGCIGQIINFGRDEDEKCVLAPNLGELLKLLDTKLEENIQVIYGLNDDGIEMFALDNTHLSDALKTIVKSKYV